MLPITCCLFSPSHLHLPLWQCDWTQGCKLSLHLMSVCKMSTWSDALALFPHEYALVLCYGLCCCSMWSETYKTHPCACNLFMSLSQIICVCVCVAFYHLWSGLKSRYMGALVAWQIKAFPMYVPGLTPPGEQCYMPFNPHPHPPFSVCLFCLLSK